MSRRIIALVALACIVAPASSAPRRTVAVPFYSAAQFAHALHHDFTFPRTQAFDAAAKALESRIRTWCAGGSSSGDAARRQEAREGWQEAMVAWVRASAVTVGPLVTRKSARVIDFAPVRETLIERAIASGPKGAAAMELVGGPAKGFGALEWLLWTQVTTPGTPACDYAVEVAADIAREASALALAFAALATQEWDEASASAALDEAFNQWLGAIDRLRWAQMDKPLRAAGGGAPDYPRAASKSTRAQWRAQWNAIETLGYGRDAAPAVGEGLIPWAAYLRGRGHNAGADALGGAITAAGVRIEAANPARSASVTAAAASLAALKRLAESKVAPALKISVGFSDADGD